MSHRPNILKLATKISLESLTYTGITYNDPEYRILDPLVTDEMCEVMMHLRLEANRTAEDVAKRAKKDLAYVKEQLSKLVQAGIIRIRVVDGKDCYYYPIWVPGIMEGIMSNREQCDKYPVLGECFEEYTRRRAGMLAPFMDAGMNMMRVIPVQTAIENNSRKATYDEVCGIVERAWAISVGPCSCRRSRRLMGEGCGHLEEDMCIYVNDNAINFSNTGAHRLIDKEEALDIIKRAEANGLVHEINVAPGFDDATAICNCCGCSCYALRFAEYFNTPDAVRSNYVARVDKDKCAGCGQCVENCQVNAVRLGKKLCDKPAKIERPEVTPRNSLWMGKKYLNPDYRDTRTNVTEDGTAPCKAACPANIAVQGYVKLAGEGRYAEALELIKKDNPFPAICGSICNRRCEVACTRGQIDSPVAINELKKFIAQLDLNPETRFVPEKKFENRRDYEQKIAVIGAGPAGLSCAYYLAVNNYPVTVFDKNKAPGGMLTAAIPDFRLDKKTVAAEIEVLKELGVEFRCGVEVGKDTTIAQLREEGYKAFYLAIGAQKDSALGIAGEALKGVYGAVEFLKKYNAGRKIKLEKSVAVIGEGFAAIDAARTATRCGAEKVYVIYRRAEKMPAVVEEIEKSQAEGVEFIFGAKPAEILGSGTVSALKLEDGKQLKLTAVINAAKREVEWGKLDLRGVKVSDKGLAQCDEYAHSDEPDIFVGGEVHTGPSYAISAIAAGKEAAASIHRHVHEGQSQNLGRNHRDYKAFDRSDVLVNVAEFSSAPRQVAEAPAKGKAAKAKAAPVFTEEQAKTEAGRCLGCGMAVVNEYMCVGCGVCTTHCKFDAIKLEKITDEGNGEYFSTLMKIAGSVPGKAGRIAIKNIRKLSK